MVLGECEKVSRTEKIFCCLKKKGKKKLSVGMLNMLKCVPLPITHHYFVDLFYVCVCCTVDKTLCKK